MKKALLLIATIALSAPGFAQITLKDTSFNSPVGTTDSLVYVTSGFNTQSSNNVNLAQTNFTWDLSQCSFVPSSSTVYQRWRTIPYTAETGYTFGGNIVDTANHRTIITGTFPKLTYNCAILSTISATGLFEYGRKVSYAGHSIASIVGANPTDSIEVLAQNSMYYSTTIGNNLTQRKRIQFPCTMSTSWNNLYQDTVKGIITYGTTYLDDTIWIKETVTELASVVGWGKMRMNIPMPEMASVATNSAYFDVLQVKVDYQVTDSFFVEGAPISSVTLAALGVSQGQTRLYYYYDFYRPDYVVPFARIRHIDGPRTQLADNRHEMHPEHFNPASVQQYLAETGFSVYPNPVNNGKVYVDIKEANATAKWSYTIININGQSIATDVLNVNNGKAEVTLPTNMAGGIYYITITDGERKMTKSLSIN